MKNHISISYLVVTILLCLFVTSCSSKKSYEVITTIEDPVIMGSGSNIITVSKYIKEFNDSAAYAEGYRDFKIRLFVHSISKNKYGQIPIFFEVINSEKIDVKLNLDDQTIRSIENKVDASVYRTFKDKINLPVPDDSAGARL